jgi:hypothetical protein
MMIDESRGGLLCVLASLRETRFSSVLQILGEEKRKSLEDKELCLAPRRQERQGWGGSLFPALCPPFSLGALCVFARRQVFACGRRPRWDLRASVVEKQFPVGSSQSERGVPPLVLFASFAWFAVRRRCSVGKPIVRNKPNSIGGRVSGAGGQGSGPPRERLTASPRLRGDDIATNRPAAPNKANFGAAGTTCKCS